MADIRINALATTAASTASDDFIAVDGSANGTRKLNAYSPTFGGNLTVNGTDVKINNAAGYFYVDSGSSATGMVLSRTNNILELLTANNTRLTISAAGNTTLSGNLTVSGTGQSSVSSYLSINSALAGSTYGRLISGTTTAGVPAFFATNAVNASLAIDFPSASIARIRTNAPSEIMAFSIGTTELARFETTGNFLVGTTTDGGQKLQVSGTGYFSGTLTGAGDVVATSALRVIGNSGASSYYACIASGTALYYGFDNQSLILRTNSTTALTMDSSQRMLTAGMAAFGGTTFLNLASWANGSSGFGENNLDKAVIGHLKSSTNGATIAGHTWPLTGWANLNIAGNNLYFRTNGELIALTLDSSQNATFAGSVKATTKVTIGNSAQSPSIYGSSSVTVGTTAVDLSSTSFNTGAIAVVSGYNNSGGAQGVWLIIATGGGLISTVASQNATGLTPTFSISAGKLQMSLASGSMSVVTTMVGVTGL